MIGVSFQPGANGENGQSGNGQPSAGSGVQEAIKILSLRLPRVLGARPAAAMPLLTSQGSGGNPRIDSIVNQVLSRVMPGQPMPRSGPMTSAPSLTTGAPNTTSAPTFGGIPHRLPQLDPQPMQPFTPRVIIGGPLPPVHPRTGEWLSGNDDMFSGGGGMPPGVIAPLPDFPTPTPQVPDFTEPIFRRDPPEPEYRGGYDSPFDQPMF